MSLATISLMYINLQRNTRHRWIGGVCSGLARFIGLDIFLVRILLRALCLSFLPVTWWIYGLLWIFLPAQRLYDYDELFTQIPAPDHLKSYREQKRQLKARYQDDRKAYKQAKRELKASFKATPLEFETLLESIQGRVSDRVYTKAQRVDEAARLLLPRLDWWTMLFNPDLAIVKRAVFEYFPKTMQQYLSLARGYAETHQLSSGQTPEQTLLHDLNILENSIYRAIEGSTSNVPLPEDLKALRVRSKGFEEPQQDVREALENLLVRISGKVDDTIYTRVLSIHSSILAVLPRLDTTMTQQAYNLKQTALEYLPEALDKYLNLPDEFSQKHQLSNGKTAYETLLEQLELLDNTMKHTLAEVYKQDADGLLIHGRFLKEKFIPTVKVSEKRVS